MLWFSFRSVDRSNQDSSALLEFRKFGKCIESRDLSVQTVDGAASNESEAALITEAIPTLRKIAS